ncbi:MAG TPA: hypothetical protein VEI97_04290 [bacterium]|nr:hypothetical protein [bacterium]
MIFHALLLGVFFVSMVNLPDPPAIGGGEGIVLNYGVDAEGDGDVQTTAEANESSNKEDSAPSNQEPQPEPEPTPEPVNEPTPEPEDPPTLTSDVEETVAVPVVEKPKKEDPKPVKEAPKERPKPVTNPASTYNPNRGGTGTSGTSNQATGNNNGDRPGRVGDQGDPNGSRDARALYGTPGKGTGGSGGGSLEMVGWTWEAAPNVRDVSSEAGKIVFEITVDENGEVRGIRKISSTVGPEVEQLYRDALENTSFVRTASAASGTESKGATGKVTFILRAR